MKVRSGDIEIFYDVLGEGPDFVLLHATPATHKLWQPIAERLATNYRVLLMDLRGHGESGVGEGPASMEKHAADVMTVCDAAGISKAVFGGVSLGGYILFEFWRHFRERVTALVLADTRASADTEPARTARLQTAEEVEQRGPDGFLESLAPKLLGQTTRSSRPDLVEAVRAMMSQTTAAGIAAVQRGMAARPDSVATLRTISVPTLLLFGEEDTLTPIADGELMRQHIGNSRLQALPRAGHLAVFEQEEAAHELIRNFLAGLPRR